MLMGIGRISESNVEQDQEHFQQTLAVLINQGFLLLNPKFRTIHAMAEETAGLSAPIADLSALERDIRAGKRWMLPICLRFQDRWDGS
ncbi:hypothetical protein OEZ49_10845 [Ruegeria sp. WL0004]|uniref:Uncharacterized protein n=1 Tax=Ruegeria marisflavi TaxID=2984152 RepID=A0ABT2WQS2_9RHOB|nr:hypothetical protein [Ruegeria sp. WL0004]MCU9838264.1 hypothetical protein [Ruegeria sp. WL0004]